jgi:hypothetical protein
MHPPCGAGPTDPERSGPDDAAQGDPLRSLRSVCCLALALAACSREGESPPAPDALEVERPRFDYAAPVTGHFAEANTGEFDLVDGIAYPARDPAKGTVVFVASKRIASPILAGSACPATQARALVLLRDAHWVELTLDARGRSDTFGYGSPYGGQGRAIATGGGAGEWSAWIRTASGRAVGAVEHAHYGAFEFDLPIASPAPGETSQDDRMAAGWAAWGGDAPVPAEADVVSAYAELRRAARAGDLRAYLRRLGFDTEQANRIRGLAGIEDDFAAHAARFLDPGEPEEPMLTNGFGQVGARGTDPSGAAFASYYGFTPCGGRLVLDSIGVNPQ